MKKSTRITVLISLVLISLLALGAVSAADDTAVADDADSRVVDDIQTVDDTPTTDEIDYESNDIVVTDTGDSGDLDDADTDVISDTGLKGDSDNGDEAVVSDASSPKSVLKAEMDVEEPLRAEEGTFSELYQLINQAESGATISLDKDYAYSQETDGAYVGGMTFSKNFVLNGNGHTIDGKGVAAIFVISGYVRDGTYHGYSCAFNDINFINAYSTDYGAAICSRVHPNTIRITNCNFTNNRANYGPAVYAGLVSRYSDPSRVTITSCIFINNHASKRGGAIHSGMSYTANYMSVVNCVFVNNSADEYGQAIHFAPESSSHLTADYNWWGQNEYDPNFIASYQSNKTPSSYYQAKLEQIDGNTVRLYFELNQGEAPEGSSLPIREATFSIDSGVIPEFLPFQGSILTDYSNTQDSTITVVVDNQVLTLDVAAPTKTEIKQLEVSVTNVTLPNQPVITIKTDALGKFNVSINGESPEEVDVTEEIFTIPLTGYTEGEYVVIVSRTNDPVTYDKFAYAQFKVEKDNATLSIIADDPYIVPGQTVRIIPTITPSELVSQIKYYVDGIEVPNSTLSDLPLGVHNVVAKFEGDDTYNAVESNIVKITVVKIYPQLHVGAQDATYPNDVYIFIYLVLEGEDGRPQFLDGINILVTVGDITYPYVTSSYPLVINGLDAGEYTINAVSMGTDIYGSVRNDTEKFIVEKNHLTISASVSAPSVDAGEEVVFSNIITAPERTVTAGTVTYYIDGEPIEGDRLSNLTPGAHYLVAKYSGDINFYDAASEEVMFNVVGTIDYVIDAPEVTYPADATIKFQSSVPGRYTLSVNDIDYFIVVESAGQIKDIVIPSLNAGSYDIALKANIENYYPIDLANAYTLVVKPVETELVISPKEDETVYYGDVANITVSITEGATGTITYYVDGVEKDTMDITNEFAIAGLSGGEHTVVAEYAGNENYKAVNSTAITITVNPLSPTLTVTTQKIRYGQNATISIGLVGLNDEKLDGVVKVTIDGKEYNVTVSEGVGTLTVSGLNLNTVGYPITAEFAGNDNYTSAINDTEEQEVNPFVPLIEVMPIEIIYGEDAVVNITLTGVNGEKLDGNVYVQLDISPFGEYQNVTVTDGVGKFTAIGLNAGTYALKGYFIAGGNYEYASFVKDDAINVIKSNSSIELKANATDIEYGETVSISAELLCGDVTGEILYYVDERMYEGYTIEGLDLDELGAGEHTVSVRYLGDENYNPSDYDSLTITVSKSTPTIECTVSSNNITYGESVELSSTLSPIAVTGKVIYYLDGEAVNGTTLSGLAVGKHNVVAKYPGDDNFNAVESNTVTIIVNKAMPDITVTSEPVKYPNDAVVNFALTGINGTALPGTTIRVTVNGVTYAVVTDEEGKASLTLKGLTVNEYPIEAVSVATDLYESASDNTANVVVEKGSLLVNAHVSNAYPYVGDVVVFTYTLSATQGGLTGGTVTYYVDGVAIDGDRLSNLSAGTHTVVANYTNDPNYKDAVSLPVTIHVLERAVNVTIECDPVAYPNNGTITLTASAAGNYTVIVGEQSQNVEVATDGGSVTISVAKMNIGTYDVEVKNSDGFVERFEDAYTVIPGNITYTLEAPTVTYPENVILYFGASAMGEYIININGTEKNVTIWGNEIQGMDIGIWDAGVYDIGLRANIDNYNPIDIAKETTLTVLKAETEFTISQKEGETVYYGAVANLTVSLTEGATGNITYYVDGVEKATIDVANEFGIVGLGVGEHTVTAKYNGDKNHLANESTTTITVNKIPLTINIEGDTVSYPDDARVLVDVYGPNGVGLDGITVLVTVNDVTYVVETGASDMGTPLIIKGLDAGEYPITAVSIENDNYQATTYAGDAKVVVNRGDTTITVFAANQTIKYGETTELSSVLSPGDATGDITYYVDEASIEGTTVSGLDVGVHTVVAIYDGNKNYKDAWSDPIIITVIKATPTITINANATNITYGDFVDVWVEIPEIRGVVPVTYYVDGEAVEGNTSGKTLSVYDAGNLTVYVTFAGNEDFNPCESEKLTITINKADPTVTVFPNQTTIKYGETIKLEAMVVPDDPSAVVTYYVDGEAIEGDIVSGLGVGTHTVVAKYQGNKNYNAAESKTVNITVNKAIPNITVTSEPVNYPNDAALNIALTAVNGTAIPGTTIRVTVNGVTYAVVTDEEGKASLTLKGLDADEYPIEAVSVATDLYESASDNTTNVVVEKGSLLVTAHVSDAYPYVGDEVVFTYTLSATQGGLTGGTVTYYVDGVAIDGDRLSNLTDGTHILVANYTNDPNYKDAVSLPVTIHVLERAIVVSIECDPVAYPNNGTITLTASEAGNYTVIVGEQSQDVEVATDGGSVTISVAKMNVGTYDVEVRSYGVMRERFPGAYEVVPGNVTYVLEAPTVTYPSEATLHYGFSAPGEYIITINGTEKTIYVVDTQEYDVNIGVFDVGVYDIGLRANIGNYNPIDIANAATLTVLKAETALTISQKEGEAVVYGDTANVTVSLTEGATGTITYYVDGVVKGIIPVGDSISIEGLSGGEHDIVAKYSGDEKYAPVDSNVITINVAKAQLVVTVEDVVTYYPTKATVEVFINNDGVYTITVNDREYNVTVENGKGSFNVVQTLPVGGYPITWDIGETENYTDAKGSSSYNVLKRAPDFSITGSGEIDYGKTNTIVPTINGDATGTITYTINDEDAGTLDVGVNLETGVLDAGHYTVSATYNGDTKYGPMTKRFEFDVLPVDVVVSVACDEVTYPNTGSISLNASAPGTYTVKVGNNNYTAVVTEANVPVVVEVGSLDVGRYEINVTAPDSTNYKALDSGAIGTYVVSKAKSVINVTYDPATGKATVTLKGADDDAKLNESISFELDSKPIVGAKTTDGVYENDNLNLAPGKHSILVVFVGNDNYLGSYGEVTFDVDKFNTAEVTVTADPIKEGDNAIIKVTVKDGDKGLSGVVTVTLEDTDYAVDVTDGEGTLTVKNMVARLSPKTVYPITAKFNGNDEYAEATGTGSIEVTDYNDVIIVISGGDNNAQATLIDSDLKPINGKVNVTVDDNPTEELDVVDGKVIIPVDEEGDHEITVSFPGDETHKENSESATVFVGKKLIPTNMVLTVSDITYTENEEVVVTLKDENGYSLSGKVTLTIGDLVREVTITDGQGKTTISGLDAGTKTVIGEFVSDGTYAGTVVSTTFTVKQMKTRIIANNMTTAAINISDDGRIGKYLTMTLVDAKGRVLANKKVSFGFNAKVYNRTTDANGQAKLQINLQKAGDYTFAITFLGDKNYEGAFEVVKITVKKQKATMTSSSATYKASAGTKTLSATLKNAAGNPMPQKKVTFTVNGKTYSATTNSKGVAKVNVSLNKKGTYSVDVKFAGTSTYEALTKKVTLKLT